jgi:heme/copper-type cytochrome/quinol oxidase subunit 3
VSARPEERPAMRVLDVSHLPAATLDARDPVWWGNTLLLFIESTSILLMLMVYFYLQKNFDHWPPPRIDTPPALFDPLPDLGASSWNLVLLLLGCVPIAWTDRIARRHITDVNRRAAEASREASGPTEARTRDEAVPRTEKVRERSWRQRGEGTWPVFALMTLAGVVSIWLRFREFHGLKFPWDANAYASTVWTLLGLHLTYIVLVTIELLLLTIWVGLKGLTDKLARDVTCIGITWYWTAGVWLVLYLVVDWFPRWK